MAQPRSVLRLPDINRLLRGARKSGFKNPRLTYYLPNNGGKMVVTEGSAPDQPASNEWDQVLGDDPPAA